MHPDRVFESIVKTFAHPSGAGKKPTAKKSAAKKPAATKLPAKKPAAKRAKKSAAGRTRG